MKKELRKRTVTVDFDVIIYSRQDLMDKIKDEIINTVTTGADSRGLSRYSNSAFNYVREMVNFYLDELSTPELLSFAKELKLMPTSTAYEIEGIEGLANEY